MTHQSLQSKDEGALGSPDIESRCAMAQKTLSESKYPKFVESKATVGFIQVSKEHEIVLQHFSFRHPSISSLSIPAY